MVAVLAKFNEGSEEKLLKLSKLLLTSSTVYRAVSMLNCAAMLPVPNKQVLIFPDTSADIIYSYWLNTAED